MPTMGKAAVPRSSVSITSPLVPTLSGALFVPASSVLTDVFVISSFLSVIKISYAAGPLFRYSKYFPTADDSMLNEVNDFPVQFFPFGRHNFSPVKTYRIPAEGETLY